MALQRSPFYYRRSRSLQPPGGIEVKGKDEDCPTLLQEPHTSGNTLTPGTRPSAIGTRSQLQTRHKCWPGLFQLRQCLPAKKRAPLSLALCPQAGAGRKGRAKAENARPSEKPRKQVSEAMSVPAQRFPEPALWAPLPSPGQGISRGKG